MKGAAKPEWKFGRSTVTMLSVLGIAGSCMLPGNCAESDEPESEAREAFLKQLGDAKDKHIGLGYWIELDRGGKKYHCNNKVRFRSGDRIRFHLIPVANGYAYLLLKKGSSGESGVLFPEGDNETSNIVQRGKDYAIPKEGALEFDKASGTETIGLLFSRRQIHPRDYLKTPAAHTIQVAHLPEDFGAKGLRKTQDNLSWDEPEAVMIAETLTNEPLDTVALAKDHSLITAIDTDTTGVIAIDVLLEHR